MRQADTLDGPRAQGLAEQCLVHITMPGGFYYIICMNWYMFVCAVLLQSYIWHHRNPLDKTILPNLECTQHGSSILFTHCDDRTGQKLHMPVSQCVKRIRTRLWGYA